MKKQIIILLSAMLILSGCNTAKGEIITHPEFIPIGGVYKADISVAIDTTLGDKLYYTTDGSTPTKESLKYSGEFVLNEPTLVRALAIKKDGTNRYSMTMYDFDLAEDVKEHKKSPIWTDQIIYFALLDRLYNGDKSNDDMGYNETNVDEETWFSGGDFKGLEQKLDYIKELGATAIWITPPVKNEWSEGNFGGSHGYWASDFMSVDPHYGDLAAYKSFVDSAHSKGLYVIQDIVVNHVGDYFNISGNDSNKWSLKPNTLPTKSPEQLPWSLNDPSLFTEDELFNNSFYNWTPAISDYNDSSQLFTHQLSNLDDIRTTNPVVRNLLRGYFRYWIDKVDIDAYRVDTVKYVEQQFFEDFVNSTEEGNKGIKEHAKDLGKDDFILFGESWDQNEDLNASYTLGDNGEKRLDSIIYFNLNFVLRNVFGNGNPTSELTNVLKNRESAGYLDSKKLVTFVDNHDMERLINSTTENLVKEAYAFIMTIPGIPQLYYGTEQNFTERRAAMFKGGFKSSGIANDKDYFDTDSEWFRYIKGLTDLRKNNSVFRNGKVTIVKDNSFGNGLMAYKLVEEDGGRGKEAFVVFNTSMVSKVGINMESNFTANAEFNLLNPSSDSIIKNFKADENGHITIAVPGESFGIYLMESIGSATDKNSNNIVITSSFDSEITDTKLIIEGSTVKVSEAGIFVDGNYKKAITFKAGKTWSTTMDLATVTNGEHEIIAFIKSADVKDYIYSKPVKVRVRKPFIEIFSITDKAGDEKYRMPSNETFIGQQDIVSVKVLTSGSDIRLDFTMRETTNVWSPNTNDFDHVLFNIFIQKEDSESRVSSLPGLNAELPENMKSWDYFVSMAGWSSTILDKNSSAISPSPTSVVDHVGKTISINIPSSAIGDPNSLKGWKIYISTWDEDSGNLRSLTEDGDEWVFGGADGTKAPLIMDETDVITLK